MGKVILLILDGFGVGYMDDVLKVRKRDFGANTALHIVEQIGNVEWNNLEYLGIGNILNCENQLKKSEVSIFGKSKLQHHGGDTFLGHQEIMGTKTEKPLIKPFSYYVDNVYKALVEKGYKVEKIGNNAKILWVNNCVAIGDNLETDLGQVYNVTTSFNEISFEEELEIGRIVRDIVKVERVIVFGGEDATKESIMSAIREVDDIYIGVDAPMSKVYNRGYMVRHLGYGVNFKKQIPYLLGKKGIRVVLIGKVADIVENPYGESFLNLVDTDKILDITLNKIKEYQSGFFCINIQETDLSGHAQDSFRYNSIIEKVDKFLPNIMNEMNEEDLLIITADHGNDPTIGHSQHTRENVPLMIYTKNNTSLIDIGTRECMSDTAATILEFFNIENTLDQGISYLNKIK